MAEQVYELLYPDSDVFPTAIKLIKGNDVMLYAQDPYAGEKTCAIVMNWGDYNGDGHGRYECFYLTFIGIDYDELTEATKKLTANGISPLDWFVNRSYFNATETQILIDMGIITPDEVYREAHGEGGEVLDCIIARTEVGKRIIEVQSWNTELVEEDDELTIDSIKLDTDNLVDLFVVAMIKLLPQIKDVKHYANTKDVRYYPVGGYAIYDY